MTIRPQCLAFFLTEILTYLSKAKACQLITVMEKGERHQPTSILEDIPSADESPRLYTEPVRFTNSMPPSDPVSSCGSITYNAARYVDDIRPLEGRNEYSVKNSKALVDRLETPCCFTWTEARLVSPRRVCLSTKHSASFARSFLPL